MTTGEIGVIGAEDAGRLGRKTGRASFSMAAVK